MIDELETKEPSVKVELHFHISLAAASRPDWTPWMSAYPNAPRTDFEPPRKSRWIAKSFGALALVSLAVVGVSFVHRLIEGKDNQTEFVSALASQSASPLPVAVTHVEKPLAAVEAPQAGAEVPRRGSAAFGLR